MPSFTRLRGISRTVHCSVYTIGSIVCLEIARLAATSVQRQISETRLADPQQSLPPLLVRLSKNTSRRSTIIEQVSFSTVSNHKIPRSVSHPLVDNLCPSSKRSLFITQHYCTLVLHPFAFAFFATSTLGPRVTGRSLDKKKAYSILDRFTSCNIPRSTLPQA